MKRLAKIITALILCQKKNEHKDNIQAKRQSN